MRKYVFLYKENDSEDRDCVKYTDMPIGKFECNYYFSGIGLTGACFSTYLDWKNDETPIDFDNITTILSKEDFSKLIEFDKIIIKLGYGIVEGDDKYQKGIKAIQEIQPIIDKLNSEENENLFKQVIQEEKEWAMEEYNLSQEEVDLIFESSSLDYQDRSIISYIWRDIDDCAMDEADAYGLIANETVERYFDYDQFGQDLLNDGNYFPLDDGRVVKLNC
jgi:hypothetical protein